MQLVRGLDRRPDLLNIPVEVVTSDHVPWKNLRESLGNFFISTSLRSFEIQEAAILRGWMFDPHSPSVACFKI